MSSRNINSNRHGRHGLTVLFSSSPTGSLKGGEDNGHPILLWRKASYVLWVVSERYQIVDKEDNPGQESKETKVQCNWYIYAF